MAMTTPHVALGIINPKNASNIGAVMRAAGCYRVDAVWYTGHRYDRAVKLNTDTKDVRYKIPLNGVDCLLESVSEHMKVICVELAEGAMPLPSFQHPEHAFYIFGSEDDTIGQEIIDRADAVVYVPTVGCMNLAGSVNVVLYDRLAKSDSAFGSDALIRSSRDTNNRVKVRR